MNGLISFEDVTCFKGYDESQVEVLSDYSMSICKGELVTILGPSGSGKSTVLRLIIGLDEYQSGQILYKGKNTSEWNVLELRREIGMVFQLPYMFQGTVHDNILYGPQVHKKIPANPNDFVHRIMDQVGLPLDLEMRRAEDLSVGQKMRVSLARTLANEPEVLLLDEPTASLDPTAANRILELIRYLNQNLGLTIITVTHEVESAHSLGGRSLILIDGRIVDEGSVDELKQQASSSNTQKFLAGTLT